MDQTLLMDRALPRDDRFAQFLDSMVCVTVLVGIIAAFANVLTLLLAVIVAGALFAWSFSIRKTAISRTVASVNKILSTHYKLTEVVIRKLITARVPAAVKEELIDLNKELKGRVMSGGDFVTLLESRIARGLLQRHISTILADAETKEPLTEVVVPPAPAPPPCE